MSKKPVQMIEWVDSSLQNGQVDSDDFPKPTTIMSVGFIVDETDEYITIARDDMGNGDFRGLCSIPKFAITTSSIPYFGS